MNSSTSPLSELVSHREKILRYAFIIQFIAAIPFLAFAWTTGKVHAQLLLRSNRARGTVVALVPIASTRSTTYQPVVEFTVDDEPIRFREWKSTKIAPAISSQLPVLYDPSDPDVAMVDRGYLNFIPWGICASIGLFLVLVAFKGLLFVFLRPSRS